MRRDVPLAQRLAAIVSRPHRSLIGSRCGTRPRRSVARPSESRHRLVAGRVPRRRADCADRAAVPGVRADAWRPLRRDRGPGPRDPRPARRPTSVPPELIDARPARRTSCAPSSTRSYPPARRDADNLSLRALGLLRPDQDVAALQLSCSATRSSASTTTKQKRMVVVTDSGLIATGEDHVRPRVHSRPPGRRLRPQLAADRCRRRGRPGPRPHRAGRGRRDRRDVPLGVRNLSRRSCGDHADAGPRHDAASPSGWSNSSPSPLHRRRLWAGSLTATVSRVFTRLDAAFVDPPDSTEQVIHPDKWDRARSRSRSIRPDLVAALVRAGRASPPSPMGEAMLADHGSSLLGLPSRRAGRARAGAATASSSHRPRWRLRRRMAHRVGHPRGCRRLRRSYSSSSPASASRRSVTRVAIPRCWCPRSAAGVLDRATGAAGS